MIQDAWKQRLFVVLILNRSVKFLVFIKKNKCGKLFRNYLILFLNDINCNYSNVTRAPKIDHCIESGDECIRH